MLRRCKVCNIEKPATGDNFVLNKNCELGISFECRSCNRIRVKNWYLANKDRQVVKARKTHLKRAYNLTLEDFEYRLNKQNNRCALCNNEDWGCKGPCVDHDHATGEVRALLCSDCNMGLGAFKDSEKLFLNAIEYIKKYQTRSGTRIIGLIGPAASGKSTVAKHLEDKYGATELSFADPLKGIIQKAFDMEQSQLYGSQVEKETVDPRYNVSPRWLMQRLGTEGFKPVFGEDVWVDYLISKLDKDKPQLVVVSDVRYPNEAKAIKQFRHDTKHQVKYGMLLKLNAESRKTTTTNSHSSESSWSNIECDYNINHDGKNLNTLLIPVDEICYKEGICPIKLV